MLAIRCCDQFTSSGGTALAALLWGDSDFSGALATTVYRQNFTEVSDIADISLANRGYRYLRDKAVQLYPYGYGLSYTAWSTPKLAWSGAVRAVSARSMGRVNATVTVRNMGRRPSSLPVLLFVQRVAPTAVDSAALHWPNKWLVAFEKAKSVAPSATRKLELSFGADEMARWVVPAGAAPESGGFRVVPGEYRLTVQTQRGNTAASLPLTITA